ncbi:MAG: PKD domain-containing protein, partial [bacterium]
DGNTFIRAFAPGLGEVTVPVTVFGLTPFTTSTPPLEVEKGTVYTYDVEATDPNGDTLTYSLLVAPDGMSIDPDTGLITWSPPAGQPQTGNDVIVQISDPYGNNSSQSFSIFIVVDDDHDGFDNRVDCDDSDPNVNPGLAEIFDNGLDDDCNPATSDAPPIAGFIFSPLVGSLDEPIQFTDKSTARIGAIVTWRWEFGDGSISILQDPTHVYVSGGTYTVTLTVTDDSGVSDSLSQSVRINEAPEAAISIAKGMNVAELETGASVADSSGGLWPERAIDGQSGGWQTPFGSPANQWIKVKLVGETDQVLDRVSLRGCACSYYVKDFEIRVSTTGTDDTDFVSVFSGTVPQEDGIHEFTFAPVRARYVQLFIISNWGYQSYTLADHFQVWTRDHEGGIVSLLEGPKASVVGSSGWAGNLSPENMLDDSPATAWYSAYNETTDQWVKVELGGGKIYTINRVRLQTSQANYGIKDFEIRVSSTTADDSKFTAVFTGTAANNTDLQEFSFTPVEARYVQLFVKENYGGRSIYVSTFQVLTPDGANAARLEGVGAFVVGYSNQQSAAYGAEKAIDFSPSTLWRTENGQVTNQWIKVLLIDGGPHLIDRVQLQGLVTDFQIRVSNKTLADADFATVLRDSLPGDRRSHWFSFPPVEAKYVQLFIENNKIPGYNYIQVEDFKVFSSHLGGPAVPFDDASVDPDGDIVAWEWVFGDSITSNEQHPVHTYSGPGQYTVTLTVTDSDGLKSTDTVDYTVLGLPSVDFSWSPEPPGEGDQVTFTGIGEDPDGSVIQWQWEFPDRDPVSTVSNTAKASFNDNGEYPVTVTVMDSQLLTNKLTKTVTVVNLPPTTPLLGPDKTQVWGLDWGVNTYATDPGKDDQATLVCDFDFGDGQTARIPECKRINAPHIYSSPGVYTATVSITDKDGASTSDSLLITVTKRDSLLNILEGVDPADTGEVEVTARIYDYYNLVGYHYIDPNQPLSLAGRSVTFSLGSETVSAITDDMGIAKASFNIAEGTQNRLTASFEGDEFYNADLDEDISFKPGDVLAGAGDGKVHHFDHDGNLLQVLDSYNPRELRGGETTGICFDSANNMYTTNFNAKTMSKFTKRGGLLAYPWGDTLFWMYPESCVVDADDNIYSGEINDYGPEWLRKFNTEGDLLKEFSPISEDRGIDWIDLSADQCTMFYSSEGSTIKRYDICKDEQLPDFATGLNRPCFALRIRPNGEVIAACSNEVYRLSASGAIIRTYPRSEYNDQGTFFAMNLDPDGTSFWTALYYPGKIYRIDIETGKLLTSFEADVYPTLAGLAVYGEETAARNLPPVAEAGPDQTVASETVVTLDGSGSSDPNPGQTITFRWLQLSGPSVTVNNSDSSTPTCKVMTPGEYTFELTVSDGRLSGTDTVMITVEAPPNDPPVADAGGPYILNEGSVATLDGSGSSDQNGDELTYAWDLDNDGQYDDANGVSPNFKGIDDGAYTIGLKVTDGLLEDTDTTTVTVNNVAPFVEAGPDQTTTEGISISLLPATFSDPGVEDTHTATINWGDGIVESASLTESNGSGIVEGSHTYSASGSYTVTTNVIDKDGGSGSDTLKVTVEPSVVPEQTIFDLFARAKDSKVDIVWTPVAGAESYNIYRSTTQGGPYTLIVEGYVTGYAVYADSGLTNGVTYYYVVTSVTNGVESLHSNEASGTPRARVR